jgi:hypothetical protein
MRRVHTATVLAAIVALLAACGQDTSSSEAGADATPPTTTTSSGGSRVDTPGPAWTGEVIPDGTYGKSATIAEAKRLGLEKDVAAEILGEDGSQRLEIKIAGDRYVHFVEEDAAMVVGDEGTATYDADGNWVATSESTGCPGCVLTFGWSLNGGRLTLTMLDTTEAGDPVDVLVSRLVTEGEWAQK